MQITRIVLIAALFSLMTACASSPSYKPAKGANGYGHSSYKIAENRYRVNFNGGRRADYQAARDYALLRAAELTLSNGYDWFQIVDRESTVREVQEPRVGVGYTQTYSTYERCGLLSCSRSVQPATYTSVSFDSRSTRDAHHYSIEIVMDKGKLPKDGSAYDADEIVKSIGDRV